MKQLLKLVPLPFVVLGSFLAIFITVAAPSKAEAIVCSGDQVAIRQVASAGGMDEYINSVNGAGGEYAQCVTPVRDCANQNQVRIAGTAGTRCFDLVGDQQIISCGAGNSPIRQGPRANSAGGDVEACRPEAILDTPACRERIGNNNVIAVVVPGRGFDVTQDCRQLISTSSVGSDETVGQDEDGVIKSGMGSDPDDEEDEEPTCGTMATNIGWYLCPIISAAVKFADGMWGIFESLLIIEPLRVDSPVHDVWQVFRTTANVILTIVFLIVIFSQVSNVGISNYGIKKMLPKILIASVAINISFFLMQIAIDLANSLTGIIGGTIRDAAGPIDPANRGFETALEDIIVMQAAVVAGAGTVMIATAVAGPVAVLLFIALLLVPVLFGVLAGTLTLLLRELLIPILAIFAPLAFVFYLLPNTEKISKKWSSIFIGLLSFSVVAAIMYEGAMLVLMIIVAGEENPVLRIAALSSIFFLMVLLPFLAFKINPLTARAFNAMRSGLNKVASPGIGLAKGMRDDSYKARRAQRANQALKSTSRNPLVSIPRAYQRRKRNLALATALDEKQADQSYREQVIKNQNMVDKMNESAAGKKYLQSYESEAIENQATQYENRDGAFLNSEFAAAQASGDTVKMRAILKVIAETGGDPGPRQIRDLLEQHAQNMSPKQYESVMGYLADNQSGLMGKDLVMKEMLTNIYKTKTDASGKVVRDASGKAIDEVNKMSVSQAKQNVINAHSAGGTKMDSMTAAKFAGLSGPDKKEFLENDSIRKNMPVSLLQELVDPSSSVSQAVDAGSKQKIRDELNARGAGVPSSSAAASGTSSPRGGNPPGTGNFTQQTPSGLIVPKSFGSAPASPPAGGTPVVNNITNNNVTQTTAGSAPATTASTPAAPPTPQPQPVQVNVQPAPAPAPTSPQPPQFTVPQSNAPQAPRSPQSSNPQPPKPNDGPRPPFGS